MVSTAFFTAATAFRNDLPAALIPAALAARFRDSPRRRNLPNYRPVLFIPAVFHHEKHAQNIVHCPPRLSNTASVAARKGNDFYPTVIPPAITCLRDVSSRVSGSKNSPGSRRGRLITLPPLPLFPALQSASKTPVAPVTPHLVDDLGPSQSAAALCRRRSRGDRPDSGTDCGCVRSAACRKSYARINVTDSAGDEA